MEREMVFVWELGLVDVVVGFCVGFSLFLGFWVAAWARVMEFCAQHEAVWTEKKGQRARYLEGGMVLGGRLRLVLELSVVEQDDGGRFQSFTEGSAAPGSRESAQCRRTSAAATAPAVGLWRLPRARLLLPAAAAEQSEGRIREWLLESR